MSFFFVTEKSKMPSSATGVGMPICLLGGVLFILTQKNSQKFGDVLGIFYTLCASNNHRDIKIENKTTTNYDILNNSYP